MQESKLRSVIKYVVPTMMGSVCFFMFTIIDGIFVGRGVGAYGLGAVNLTMPFVMIVNALFMLFTAGGVTIVAVQFGKGDKNGANEAYIHSMLIALVISVVMCVLGVFFTKPLCVLLGADETYFQMTHDYLFWYSVFIIPSGLSTALQGFVRNDGEPVLVSAAIIAGTLLNIFGDWICIFPLKMGLAGAAIATGVSQTATLVILLFHFARKDANLHLFRRHTEHSEEQGVRRSLRPRRRALRGSASAPLDAARCLPTATPPLQSLTQKESVRGPEFSSETGGAVPAKRRILNWSLIAEILLRGLPECISKFTAPMTTLCLNYVLIRRIGTIGINAYSVISYVASFAVAVFFGTAEGLQPLFGHCHGSKNVKSLHYYFKAGMVINVLGAVIIEGLLFVIGESVCRLFGIDGETLLYTVQVMRFYSVGYIAVAVTTIVSAYLYSTTRTAQAVILNAVRSFAVNVLVILLFPVVFGNGIIWWTFLIYETIMAAISLLMLKSVE